MSLEDSSNCPCRGTMLAEEGKRLFHSPPAADAKTQLHTVRRVLRPWGRHSQTLRFSRTHSGGVTADRCMDLHTWRRPQPNPDSHPDEHGDTQTFTQDTHGRAQERRRQIICDSQTEEEMYPDT